MDISNGLVLDADFRGYSPRDKSVYGNILTNFGSIWTPQGYVFDGVNDYIDCGNNNNLNIINEITIEAYINTSDINADIISKFNAIGNQRAYSLSIVSGKVNARISNDGTTSTQTAITSNSSIIISDWVHVIFIYNGINLNIYIDNIQDATSVTKSGTIFISNDNLYIGRSRVSGFLEGKIGIIRIWNRSISTMERTFLYSIRKYK